jgi:hypothetical protein
MICYDRSDHLRTVEELENAYIGRASSRVLGEVGRIDRVVLVVVSAKAMNTADARRTIVPPESWAWMLLFMVVKPDDSPWGSPVPRVLMIADKTAY